MTGGGRVNDHYLIPIEELVYKGIVEHVGNRCVVCGYEEFFDEESFDVRPACG